MVWTRMLLAAAVALLLSATPAQAATFRVVTTTDSTQPCNGTDCPSIRSALAAAALSAGDDTITVPAGEYQLVIGQLLVDSPVTILGEGARSTTIRGNAQAFRVLEVASGIGASVTRATLADGRGLPRSDGDTFLAGGVVKNSGTLTLDRVRITGGHASSGGGVANTGGNLTIDRSLIDGNAADIGGGDGGGLLNFAGGSLLVRNSTLASNTAVQAGGLNMWGGTVETPNRTTFEQVTVVGNQAGFRGGVNHDAATGDVLLVRNSIIAGNAGGSGDSNCGAPVGTAGGNVSNTAECGLTADTDRQNVDVFLSPGLENRSGDTDVWPVMPNSPAVNLIASCTGADQRGEPRPYGAGCDAGAFELTEPPIATITNDPPTITNDVHPIFAFSADQAGSTFRCRNYLQSEPEPPVFIDCASPLTVRDLTDGVHVFEVRAVSGTVVGEPASHTFRVDTDPPEPPVITDPDDNTVLREIQPLTLRGQTEPLTAVDVYDNGQLLGPAVVDGEWVFTTPELAPGTHVFTAIAKDDAGNASQPSAPVTVYVHPNGPSATIDGPVLTNDATPTFTVDVNEPNAFIECALDGVTYQPCGSPVTLEPLADGAYTLTVRPTGADNVSGAPVSHQFVVDRTPPPAPQVSGAPAGNAVTFTVASAEEGVTIECRLEGPGQSAPFAPCGTTQSYSGLAPGTYRFVVRASDRAGNVSETVREFTVASVQPQITPTPTPSATPTPQPEFRETAVARPVRGRVLVRLPGSDRFVELDGSESIPMGSTIDAKRGRVRITAETRQGRPPQRAEFYDGIFRITQTRTLVDLRLVEQLNCSSKRKAGAAQRKPKRRKLWGSGKGRFRTTGSYSAATVRGTTWLVQDTCRTTLTRVTQGVVAVRDKRLKKTILVRKGKRYVARGRR